MTVEKYMIYYYFIKKNLFIKKIIDKKFSVVQKTFPEFIDFYEKIFQCTIFAQNLLKNKSKNFR